MNQSTKYAYVMLCMKGDAYAPGVIVMAESIRAAGSTYDIVCMCTPDVSEEALELIATRAKIAQIEYVRYDTKKMRTKRQMELYGSWLSEAYTKWRCLELEYDKVLFVDADMIVVQNIDHLFELQAPAGTFSTPWAKEYTTESTFDLRGYPKDHDSVVPASTIMETFSRHNGYTFIASMVLLIPNKSEFAELCQMVDKLQPFGFENWSTPDEQSLAYFYASKGVDWHHIHQRYNFIVHKIDWLRSTNPDGSSVIIVPHVLHYFSSKKPWLMTNSFMLSPFNTDKIWWALMRKWWIATGKDIKLARWQEMKDVKKITLRCTQLDTTIFPWLGALRIPFPELF